MISQNQAILRDLVKTFMEPLREHQYEMEDGIRDIRLNPSSNTDDAVDLNMPNGGSIEISFGPHHRLKLDEDDDGNVSFELVSTHHGFEADASGPDVPTELEDMINTVREKYPENQID